MDEDEQSALEPFEDELRELRERHANDPRLEVLRAATGQVLPEELQASASAHLANSRWSRALVDGTNEVGELSVEAEARLLDRITHEERSGPASSSPRPRVWWSLLAAAGVAALVCRDGLAVSEAAGRCECDAIARERPDPAGRSELCTVAGQTCREAEPEGVHVSWRRWRQ